MRAISAFASSWARRVAWLPALALGGVFVGACSEAPTGHAATAATLLRGPSEPVLDDSASAVASAVFGLERPATLERMIEADPSLIPGLWGTFGAALAADPGDASLAGSVTSIARHRADRVAKAGPPWSEDDFTLLSALQLVDPPRVARDPVFAQLVTSYLPRTLDPTAAAILREPLLESLGVRPGVDQDALERAAKAWGAIPRASATRERTEDGIFAVEAEDAPIEGSIFSLPSSVIDAEDASVFLAALRASRADRHLVVLADRRQREALSTADLEVSLLATLGQEISPWPRDPFTVVREENGTPTVLLRPNVQVGREDDDAMGRLLVAGLPDDLDRAWGGLGWRRVDVPFHNGQILLIGDTAWISVHSLEPGILSRLGLDRVPVERFGTPAGLAYVEAARAEADALGQLFGRQARFVHPLPSGTDAGMLTRLGGGAGFDLDSLVTLLPTDREPVALIGRVRDGATMLATLPPAEIEALATTYDLDVRGEPLRQALAAAQDSTRALALDAFLEVVAGHLGRAGFSVERLPLLLVPYAVRTEPDAIPGVDFLLGWNNVVLENRDGQRRAEGFAARLPTGDVRAREAFARAGYTLDLLPPLVDSVVRNGGYRCASQHIRRP